MNRRQGWLLTHPDDAARARKERERDDDLIGADRHSVGDFSGRAGRFIGQ